MPPAMMGPLRSVKCVITRTGRRAVTIPMSGFTRSAYPHAREMERDRAVGPHTPNAGQPDRPVLPARQWSENMHYRRTRGRASDAVHPMAPTRTGALGCAAWGTQKPVAPQCGATGLRRARAEGYALPRMIACLTSEIACVTWIPRGHASVQLKVVRQRHTPSLSLRMSRRTLALSSRESKMNRCAFTMAAGPKYWPSVQKTGQLDVQAAHRMHFVVSSKRSRWATVWTRSLPSFGACCDTRNGCTSLKESKNGSMSTMRSFSRGSPLIASTYTGLVMSRSFIRVLHARRLRPLMRMASEPQMPCAHERRKVRD